jgi:hypothetical protein
MIGFCCMYELDEPLSADVPRYGTGNSRGKVEDMYEKLLFYIKRDRMDGIDAWIIRGKPFIFSG